MFEPQKFITLAIALVLLAPFGFVFWQISTHRPRPEAQVRAELEAALREKGGQQLTHEPEGGIIITSITAMRQVEAIGFLQSTLPWLSFFPRPWVGVFGLLAVVSILVCLTISLFFPGGIEMRVNELPPSSATPEQQR